MQIEWQEDAIEDMQALRQGYLAEQNPSAAARMAKRILQALVLLRQHPAMGRPGRVPDTRELVIANTPYLVAYRVIDTRLVILRVLHGAQRWPKKL